MKVLFSMQLAKIFFLNFAFPIILLLDTLQYKVLTMVQYNMALNMKIIGYIC